MRGVTWTPWRGLPNRPVLDSLFEIDAVMPAQFQSCFSGHALPAEARLYREVMESCLHDLGVYGPGAAHYDAALAWVVDDVGTITFTTAVESGYVGLDPAVVRAQLLTRLVQQRFTRAQYVAARAANRAGMGTKVQAWQHA